MAEFDELFGTARRGVGAMLFLEASTHVLDVYSAVNSSPWTAETVTGGDPVKESSLKRYCAHAIGQTIFIDGLAALMAGPGFWYYPVIGAVLEAGYMTWLYYDAVIRGRRTKQGAFGVAAA